MSMPHQDLKDAEAVQKATVAELIEQLAEGSATLGHHQALRATSDDTLNYWENFVAETRKDLDAAIAALSASPAAVGDAVQRAWDSLNALILTATPDQFDLCIQAKTDIAAALTAKFSAALAPTRPPVAHAPDASRALMEKSIETLKRMSVDWRVKFCADERYGLSDYQCGQHDAVDDAMDSLDAFLAELQGRLERTPRPSAAHAPGVGDGELPPLPNASYAGIFTPKQMYAYAREAIATNQAQAQVGGDAVRGEYRASDTMIDAAQAAFDCWAIRGRGGRIKNHREAIEKAVEAAFAQAQAPDAYMDHRRACIDADLRNAVPKYAELYTRPLYAAPVPPTAVTEAMIDAALGEYLTPSETNPGREISRARMRDALTAALAARQDSEVAALRETLKRVESLIPFWERLQLAHADDAASLIDQGQHKAYGACAHNLRAAISEDSRHG